MGFLSPIGVCFVLVPRAGVRLICAPNGPPGAAADGEAVRGAASCRPGIDVITFLTVAVKEVN